MSNSIEDIFLGMTQDIEAMEPIQATMKLVVGKYIYLIDGTGKSNIISTVDADTDCTVTTETSTFLQLKSGEVDPVDALMEGKITIDGSFGVAFKLKHLIS
jgi:putative sterol carrier protein